MLEEKLPHRGVWHGPMLDSPTSLRRQDRRPRQQSTRLTLSSPTQSTVRASLPDDQESLRRNAGLRRDG